MNDPDAGLPSECLAALTRSWAGWLSPCRDLVLAWQHVHNLGGLATSARSGALKDSDVSRLRVLGESSATAWQRRSAWYETVAAALRRHPARNGRVGLAKIMAMDGLNAPTPSEGARYLAESARTLIAATGRAAAVEIIDGVYGCSVPELCLVRRAVGSVPSFVLAGRLYVL